jgi:photosynthetic reaction center H subunit
MGTGAITQYVDVAQLVLYVFWVFFAGLVYYLIYESKREGFPLETDRADGTIKREPGLLAMPQVKTYKTRFGESWDAPHDRDLTEPPVAGERIAPAAGMPIEPSGDPMTSGLGAGAWTRRADVPDRTAENDIKIVPLAAAPGFGIVASDLDPRGLPVIATDYETAGTVVEVWVDRSEHMIRYLEVQTQGGRRVLLPMTFARVRRDRVGGNRVTVDALLASQFEGVPGTRDPQSITLLEEEKITAYYGAGTLFATPSRREPLL